MKQKNVSQKGFTLIELVVVIGILAILLAIVLIAINPARQFTSANDVRRRSDATAILNAVGQYAADHQGSLPADIPTGTAEEISKAGADICSDIMPTYISAIPTDPSSAGITNCTAYSTGYSIVRDASGRVTVSAAGGISVTR